MVVAPIIMLLQFETFCSVESPAQFLPTFNGMQILDELRDPYFWKVGSYVSPYLPWIRSACFLSKITTFSNAGLAPGPFSDLENFRSDFSL